MSDPIEELRAAGLDPAFEKLERAIANHRAGDSANVAVVADPYAGRGSLLEYAEERLEAEADRIQLSSVQEADGALPLPDSEVIVVDDCHYLFRREIGGYDVLERFLDAIALSDSLVITSWNRYAWDYLVAVKDVDRPFPVEVRIHELDDDEIERLLTAHHGTPMPDFEATSKDGRIKTVNIDRQPVRVVGNATVEIPYLKPNPEWVSSWPVIGDNESIEAVVFEKIRRVSHGNPGVATSIWEDAVTNEEVAPAYVQEPIEDVDVDRQQAYLLWLIVAYERLDQESLASMADRESVEEPLQPLVNRGIVEVDADEVVITPEGLHPAVEELRRRRLLW